MSDALSKAEGIHTSKPSWEELESRYHDARTASVDASEAYAQATVEFMKAIAVGLRGAKDLDEAQAIGRVIEEAVAHCEASAPAGEKDHGLR